MASRNLISLPINTEMSAADLAEFEAQALREASSGPDADLARLCAAQRRYHEEWVTLLTDACASVVTDPALEAELETLAAFCETALAGVEALTPRTRIGAVLKADVARQYAVWACVDQRAVALLASANQSLRDMLLAGSL